MPQGGDAYGNRSTLISASNSGTQIYVKSRPKEWALQNVAAECTLEEWITLSGSVVTVRNRLTNARADATQYAARTQELPAVYHLGEAHAAQGIHRHAALHQRQHLHAPQRGSSMDDIPRDRRLGGLRRRQ